MLYVIFKAFHLETLFQTYKASISDVGAVQEGESRDIFNKAPLQR